VIEEDEMDTSQSTSYWLEHLSQAYTLFINNIARATACERQNTAVPSNGISCVKIYVPDSRVILDEVEKLIGVERIDSYRSALGSDVAAQRRRLEKHAKRISKLYPKEKELFHYVDVAFVSLDGWRWEGLNPEGEKAWDHLRLVMDAFKRNGGTWTHAMRVHLENAYKCLADISPERAHRREPDAQLYCAKAITLLRHFYGLSHLE
jgi:hypothetical protein